MMESESTTPPPPAWSWIRRVAFRFFFCYFVIYIAPFPASMVLSFWPGSKFGMWVHQTVVVPYQDLWDKVVVWTGQNVFDVAITIRPGGSGDTTWNYVQVFCFLVFAVAATLVWSLIDFRRPRYDLLLRFLRTYVRYYVASYMIIYGAMKVIKSQFPTPDTDRLLMTFGESSPMRLLWTFMGASEGYNWFTGGGEMLGGVLLCFRRTTLAGALVTFGVMLHVSALNYCYDVPVKLFSSHLVLMSVWLILPEMPWLLQAFLCGRRTEYAGVAPLTSRNWLNAVLALVNLAVVGTFIYSQLSSAYQSRNLFGDAAPRPPLYGLWDVEELALADAVRPPLLTDTERWRYVTFTRQFGPDRLMMVETMTGARMYFKADVNVQDRTIKLTKPSRVRPGTTSPVESTPIELTFEEPEPGQLVITGQFQNQKIQATLRRAKESDFLLLNRGFRWINETPYNASVPRRAERGKS